jgi:hypothetical protein
MAMLGKGMQPRLDDPSVAASGRWLPADSVDLAQDIEIGRCRAGLRLLVAGGVIMTLVSASLTFGWWDGMVAYEAEAGYAGLALFGALTCWLIWQAPAGRGPVVVITAFGIRDLRIGNEFLVWESIAEVSATECRGRRVIVLKPTLALQRQLRGLRAATADAPTGDVVIDSDGLATDFDTLLRACRTCHAASRSASASLHEHEQVAQEQVAQGFAAQAS